VIIANYRQSKDWIFIEFEVRGTNVVSGTHHFRGEGRKT
jgi:hypothetical protein